MEHLPCELKIAILEHLKNNERQTASVLALKDQRDGRHSRHATLKSLSSTCHEWRKLLHHELFRTASVEIRPDDHSCGRSRSNSSDATRFRQAMKAVGASIASSPYAAKPHLKCVDTLTIRVDNSFMTSKALRNPAQHSTDIITINEFWRRIFEVVDPLRLTLIAPVNILGWLTTAVPDMDDVWAFPDMKLQALELEQDYHIPLPPSILKRKAAESWDTEYLFNVRPWTRIKLMEGSMLQAYDVYEYFNRIPPSIVRGLIFPRSDRLTSFSNTVLFPFSNHIDHMQLVSLAYYKDIHFHFAPNADHNLLDDDHVVRRNVLDDCWREIEQIYTRAVAFDPPSPLFREGSALNRFSTGDYDVDSIRELLDRAFDVHAGAGWISIGHGVWVKQGA